MSQLYIALGSAVAIAIMVAIAFALGFRARASITDEAHLRALILEAEPGASLAHMVRDRDGHGGLAKLADGRWAAVASLGDRLAVRIFSTAQIRRSDQRVRAQFGDAGFPGLDLRLHGPAPDWLA